MNEQDKVWWEAFREQESTTISNEELVEISRMHSVYFNHKYHKPCGCNGRKVQQWINDLNKFYLEH